MPLIAASGAAASPPGPKQEAALNRAAGQFVEVLLAYGSDAQAKKLASVLLDEAFRVSGSSKPRDDCHFICELIEALVVEINSILALPGQMVDAIVDQFESQWLPAAVAKAVLKHLLNAVISLSIGVEAMKLLALKASALAIACCPDIDRHPSLERNCVPILAREGLRAVDK